MPESAPFYRRTNTPSLRDTALVAESNAEIWAKALAALNAGDLEGLYSFFDPDVVYTSREDEPDRIVGAGFDDFKQMIEAWTSTFDDFVVDIEETFDVGERTISVTRLRGTGSSSGVEIDDAIVFLISWRARRFIEISEYRTKQEALHAAPAAVGES